MFSDALLDETVKEMGLTQERKLLTTFTGEHWVCGPHLARQHLILQGSVSMKRPKTTKQGCSDEPLPNYKTTITLKTPKSIIMGIAWL